MGYEMPDFDREGEVIKNNKVVDKVEPVIDLDELAKKLEEEK